MKEEVFRDYFTGENAARFTITCSYYSLFEYKDLLANQVEHLQKQTLYLSGESAYRSTMTTPEYLSILEQYQKKQTRIDATLFILQIPVLILLGAFLFMISCQMYDLERNEISVIKSRGSSTIQIFLLYFYQSIFLSAIGAFLGMPLGILFSRILGSTQNFLEFDIRRELVIEITCDVLLYALVAIGVSILIMTIPACKHSKLTIVRLKQNKVLQKRSWWEVCFLDFICLGISLYGYYNYKQNEITLVQSVLKGDSLDPLLYISSSLFIVGLGLLFLRIQPFIIKGIYILGKNLWRPASYTSFIENIKNGKKQQFIMIFMILTISLGMFHATVARTILRNAEDNAEYIDGADFIVKEVWGDNSVFASIDNSLEFQIGRAHV